jgi:hypothetical protein
MPVDRLLFGASVSRISHHTDHPARPKWLAVFGFAAAAPTVGADA